MNNFVGLSKIGLVRQRNEDRFFIDGPICAVTDGMGGYSGGGNRPALEISSHQQG